MDRPSPAASQGRSFLQLFSALRPHVATDRNLPSRLQQLLAREKRFGSRDRRLYRELLYTALRHLPWIDARLATDTPDDAIRATAWLAADTAATRAFRAHWTAGWPEVPATVAERARHLSADPAALLPAWFAEHCPAAFQSPAFDALHTRAPLWIRLQTDDATPVLAEFEARGWSVQPAPVLSTALEVLAEADLTTTDAYARGLIEIQDLGSQLLLARLSPAPAGHWLDACAGAGGKTLQLARLLGTSGKVDAHDIRASALDELGTRAARARIANIRILSAAPSGTYDGVLIDAPCSGTGTWRRAPHLKWCTTPQTITNSATVQRQLLERYAPLVSAGGQLVYATCSLSRQENEDVITAFLAAHPEFTAAAPASMLLPSDYNTDGYFVAPLRRV
ncbi:RsmB/NOP family class I SAM-dependent RNA methyltransferase [Rariglobus hedericola]|uniref:RsmB/NOP family class I SAM-dependent RNA methyltransferase n=1 Tax=Rariglobus hedericola TaxID=2597822 RepID=A0A556QQ85_9BACT|nr:RsmB/NOP family class I SAM-dependent RNA methyltransferase [Rariglobus hedericola]TSJ78772.1 RsmB/NOP family class I SAM-dependent RNA methyltransferase [Rariglobus hedericola]